MPDLTWYAVMILVPALAGLLIAALAPGAGPGPPEPEPGPPEADPALVAEQAGDSLAELMQVPGALEAYHGWMHGFHGFPFAGCDMTDLGPHDGPHFEAGLERGRDDPRRTRPATVNDQPCPRGVAGCDGTGCSWQCPECQCRNCHEVFCYQCGAGRPEAAAPGG